MSAAPSTRAIASPVIRRFYSAPRFFAKRLQKKTRAIARVFCRLVSALAASLDHPVDDLHLVAAAPARWRGLGEQTLGAVLVTDDDLVLHGLLRVLLDRVSGKAAARAPRTVAMSLPRPLPTWWPTTPPTTAPPTAPAPEAWPAFSTSRTSSTTAPSRPIAATTT